MSIAIVLAAVLVVCVSEVGVHLVPVQPGGGGGGGGGMGDY